MKPPYITLYDKLGKKMMHKLSRRNGSISNTKMFSATMARQLQFVLLVLLCAAETTYSGKLR